MPVARDSELPADRGRRDARHHHDRVRKQISDYLREKIGDEDIVTAGPEKRLRVPVRGERRYRFIFDRGLESGAGQGDGEPGTGVPAGQDDGTAAGQGAGEAAGEILYEVEVDLDEVEETLFAELGLPRLKPKRMLEAATPDLTFDDVARRGPLLDKKATLRENLLRNAKLGRLRLGDIEKDDLRYRSYREAPAPKTQAVVFCMMDLSGSMGDLHKRVARLFFYWTVRFLRRQYTHVEVVFIGHTSEAFELTEQEFFSRRESGGTIVSSAFQLAREIQAERYPTSLWNVYLVYTSDGDNLASDNLPTLELITALLERVNLVGYLEVAPQIFPLGGLTFPGPKLSAHLWEVGLDGLVVTRVSNEREIWSALKLIFAKDGVLEAIA